MKRASLVFPLLVFFAPATALAEGPSSQDRAIAEALFREGRSLVDAGKIADACPKFVESHRLDPKVGTLMYAATCHEQEGKTATAWVEFTEAVAMAERTKQRDREKLAKERAAALEGKLSRLNVSVAKPLPEGLEVRLDGVVLGAAAYGVALPIDPGEHTVLAKAAGRKPFSAKVAVAASAAVVTEVPILEADAPPPPPPAPLAKVPPPLPEKSAPVVGYALGGAAVVALGVGTFFGLKASSQSSDADKNCSGQFCNQAGLDGHDDASTSARVSTIAFGVGLVASAAAVYFLFFDDPKGKSKASVTAPWAIRF